MTWVLGIDPGGKETGVVILNSKDDVVYYHVVQRLGEPNVSAYARRVIAELTRACTPFPGVELLVAVEGVRPPNPHLGTTNVQGLLDAARVLAAIQAEWPDAIEVPPGGNGSGPINAYPECLRPTRGSGKGKDRLRHCRSAFDCALAGRRLARVREQTG